LTEKKKKKVEEKEMKEVDSEVKRMKNNTNEKKRGLEVLKHVVQHVI
jgi:hypothetical protein